MVIGAITTIMWDLVLARPAAEIRARWKASRNKKKKKHQEKTKVGAVEQGSGDEGHGGRRLNGVDGNDAEGLTKGSRDEKEKQEDKGSSVGVVMQSEGQGELQRKMSCGGTVAVPLTDGTTVRNVADEEHKVGGVVDGINSKTAIQGGEAGRDGSGQDPALELSTDMQSHAISIRIGMIVTGGFLGT